VVHQLKSDRIAAMPTKKTPSKRTYQKKLVVYPMKFEEAVSRILKAGPMPKNGERKAVRNPDKEK
jgi:hypothetical protein